jgi:hypothetical protein
VWKDNLVAFTARGLILMSLSSKGCIEREKNGVGIMRETTFKGEGKKNTFFPSVLKVPRQCSVVLKVEVTLRNPDAY